MVLHVNTITTIDCDPKGLEHAKFIGMLAFRRERIVHDIYFPTVRFVVLDPKRLQLAVASRVSPAAAGTL
jgi:hypothetical protein